MVRTKQLVLDVHFAFPAGFAQISGLQVKSLDLYLNGLGTLVTVKKLFSYCLNNCLLSD